jgi:uncharacterized membrane protein YGL010W
MRSREQFIADYSLSHRHPANGVIHAICIPVIVVATLGLLWAIPLGRWLGLSGAWARWLNGATLAAIPIFVFYLRLSLRTALEMGIVFALSLALLLGALKLGWPLAPVCVGAWIVAWIGQFIGHKIEGKKPSFMEDLVFLLIGPLFVLEKYYRALGLSQKKS